MKHKLALILRRVADRLGRKPQLLPEVTTTGWYLDSRGDRIWWGEE